MTPAAGAWRGEGGGGVAAGGGGGAWRRVDCWSEENFLLDLDANLSLDSDLKFVVGLCGQFFFCKNCVKLKTNL